MLNIIGGSYYEICMEPYWDELYGSGFRSAVALSKKGIPIKFYTYADNKTGKILSFLTSQLSIELVITNCEKSIEFVYEHPLANPIIYPTDNISKDTLTINLKDIDNVVCFGMLEGNAKLSCNKAVYDPQNPQAPGSFSGSGSFAKELVLVLNYREATQMAQASDLETIKQYLLNKEGARAAVIKNGPEGAFVLDESNEAQIVPSFITSKVWPIGSGDIFSSYFGYEWMIRNQTLYEAAIGASLATATYANSKTLPILDLDAKQFVPFFKTTIQKKTVYLAGPFFTMAQRWLVNQFRNALQSFDLNVFSPLHDVGIGGPDDVVDKDLLGLKNCDIVVAIGDGLDSGTLFEIGYAKSISRPVIVFVENEKKESLTMLEGTGCILESDFSTVVYKALWEAYK